MGASLDRTIFRTGEYLNYFHPEEEHSPFRVIYARKRRSVIRLTRELLGDDSDARVLDLAGGMGRIAVPLATHCQVHLCDISAAMLKEAQAAADAANIPSGRIVLSIVDASKPLPFETDSFDLIVCLDLLVHLPDPQATIREIYRVLKPGGNALIDASNSMPLWVFFYPRYVGMRPRRWIKTLRCGGVLPEWTSIVHHMRHKTFLHWLRLCGFVVTGERFYGPMPGVWKWMLAIARKSQ